MGAGGLWMPYKCDDKRIDKWAIETLDELLLLQGHNNMNTTTSSRTMAMSKSQEKTNFVEIVPTVYLISNNKKPQTHDGLPEWTRDGRISFQCCTIEMLCRQNQVLKLRIPSQEDLLRAGYTHAWLFYPPVVDTPRMLSVSSKSLWNE